MQIEPAAEECVPIAELIVLEGLLNSIPVRILKDDGCNTNVVSKSFLSENRGMFEIKQAATSLSHSKRGSTEVASEVVMNAELKMGEHQYASNFVVADCRYDVLLGMPWHKRNSPRIDYTKPMVCVGKNCLPVSAEAGGSLVVSTLAAKKFRSLIRKKGSRFDFQVFHLVQKPPEKQHAPDCEDSELQNLLSRFENVFREDLPGGLPPKRSIDHAIEIEEGAKPPSRPLYQLSPAELLAVKEYVVDLLRKGKIRRSKSPFGASLFLVKEKGKLRAVVDYRALNRLTKRNNTPLPRPDEMFDRFAGSRYFSKLDLKTGFHQIRVRPEDVEKTAFNTKYGQFEYLVLPMGLCNAPATFQTLMNTVFHDCIDVFMVVYMDDLLIYSRTREEHLSHVETVLSRLRDEDLYVSPKKCSFMQPETEFLGMLVSQEGIRVNPDKVSVVQDWPTPSTITELRSFVGLLQFFRRFIKNFSAIAAPLTSLTKKGIGIGKWNADCDDAFRQLKAMLVSAPILVSPDWRKPYRCHVDASQRAVGGTLTQLDDQGRDRVVAFFSKKLSPAEEKYTANDRELLGLVYFLKRFRCYLEGSTFEVFTDNQVLKYFFTKPMLSRREARWLELFAQFGITRVNLKPGRVHVLGDVLSRAPHIMEDTTLVNTVSASGVQGALPFHPEYEDDQLFGPIVKGIQGELPQDKVQRDRTTRLLPLFSYLDGTLWYDKKICVPRRNVKDILYHAHDSPIAGHFGLAKTLGRLERYHWRHKARDVKQYVEGCQKCQQKKDSRAKKLGEPTPLDVPTRRWGSVSTDFIVKLPTTKNGFDCITTWVDRLSRRVHFIPSKVTDTAVDVANQFFTCIFKLHGLPDSVVSDRDPKFTSKFWVHLMSLCGVKRQMSSTHHPQTDGASEVMNRMVENYLRCYCSLRQDDWDEFLPSAEFAYNSARSEELQATPFEIDLGWNPRGPLDLFPESCPIDSVALFNAKINAALQDARFSHQLAKARHAAYSADKYAAPSYVVGDRVWINRSIFKDAVSKAQASDKLGSRRFGPFTILELVGKNAIRLDLPTNMRLHPVIHVSHTIPQKTQPPDISPAVTVRPEPTPDESGTLLFEVERILSHRKRGRGYQWLTLLKGAPEHEAEWQPTRDFVDGDGTLTEAFRTYIVHHGLLKHLH